MGETRTVKSDMVVTLVVVVAPVQPHRCHVYMMALHSPTSQLALLADPPVRFVDGAAMDYLLIEAVNALRASSAVATARAKKIEQEMADAGILPPPPPPPTTKPPQSHRDSIGSTSSRTQAASADDDEDEGVRTRLEAIGSHVGASFVERCAFSLVMPLI